MEKGEVMDKLLWTMFNMRAMDRLFLTILNMSLTGAFVIVAICLARLLLKKAPKIISYCLWAVAWFRLVLPFSIESVLSLIPFRAAPIPTDIAMQTAMQPFTDSNQQFISDMAGGVPPALAPVTVANPLQIWTMIGTYMWVAGVVLMVIYGIVSYSRLKNRMGLAIRVEDDTYESDGIQSPFVLGVFRPRIYIPYGLIGQEREYIILHERTHIRRHDHIFKFLSYFVLCVHWFNPLAWVAFLLMGVDMEMSCDERVLKEVGFDSKKDYSMSLLSLASNRRLIGGSPLAFSEGGLKARIKNVLKFRKPSRVIVITAVVLAAAFSVVFALNRPDSPAVDSGGYVSEDAARELAEIQRATDIRTSILRLDLIEDCLVVVSIGENSPSLPSVRESAVSIVLTLKDDTMLSDVYLRAVVNIVKGAIPGITDDNITITDSNMNYYSVDEVHAEISITGRWMSETGNVTLFYQDGRGRTEDDNGLHWFTWEIVNLNDAISQRRGFRIREFYRTVYESAESSGISWGSWDIGDLNENRPDDWGTGDYVIALTFEGVDIPFDFAFTFNGQDAMIINTMNLGQLLSPQANVDMRFEWVTYNRLNNAG